MKRENREEDKVRVEREREREKRVRGGERRVKLEGTPIYFALPLGFAHSYDAHHVYDSFVLVFFYIQHTRYV